MYRALYRFRYFDAAQGRWVETHGLLTEEDAAAYYPGSMRLDHTKEVRDSEANDKSEYHESVVLWGR
jgi:hypothetical protein